MTADRRTGTVLAMALAVAAIVVAGTWLFVRQRTVLREAVAADLTSIARGKADEVDAWRRARAAEAAALAADPAWRAWASGADAEATARARLEVARDVLGAVDVVVVAPDGRRLAAVGAADLDPATLAAAATASADVRATLGELRRDGVDGSPRLDVVAPVTGPDGADLGDLVVVHDVARSLFPTVLAWPTPSETAEGYLVRRDGGDALYLSDLRHRPGAALALRSPLADPVDTAARALVDGPGFREGFDYRGTRVASAAVPVPGSDWLVLAEIDVAEAFADANARSRWLVAFFAVAVVLALGAGVHWREVDLRRVLSALRAEQARLRAVIDASPVATSLVDASGRLLHVNPAAERTFGYTPEDTPDVEAWAVRAFPDPAYRTTALAAWRERVASARATGQPSAPLEVRVRRDDGDERIVLTTVAGLGPAAADELVVTHHDISDLRHATERAEHAQALMRHVIEHDTSAVAVHDRELRYVYVSQRYLADVGLEGRDVIGRHHDDVLPDVPEWWRAVLRRALAGEVLSGDRDPMVRPDGRVDVTRWSCRPWFERDGSIGGIVVYTEVINDRVRVEDDLRTSVARFRAISSVTSDVVYSARRAPDGTWRFEWIAGEPLGLLGRDTDALMALGTWRACVHADDVGAYDDAFGSLALGDERDVVVRVRGADGAVRHVRAIVRVDPAPDEAHAPVLFASLSDVTDAHRARTALDRFFEQGTNVHVMGLGDGTLLRVNAAAGRVLGVPAASLVGRRLLELVHPDDRDATGVVMRGLEQGRSVHGFEHRWVTADGQVRHLIWSVTADLDQGLVYGSGVDVTELRATATALARSERRLKDAQRMAKVGSWDLDLTRDALVWSEEAYRVFEVDPASEAATMDVFWSRVHPDDRAAVDAAFARARADGTAYDLAHRLRMADGRVKHVHAQGVFVAADGGRLVHAFGTVQDVTEAWLAEEHQRKLALAVEQSHESVVITDVDARIEYVNAAFVANTGYAPEEVVGENPRLLKSGKTPAATYEAMWAALRAGRPWRGEFVNRRRDGSEFVEAAHVIPLRQPDGRVTHFVAVKEDVTERKRVAAELDAHRFRLEELVRERTVQLEDARGRAEAANAAKSVFLANMSHEIRTPMNAIVGLTHLLRADATPSQVERLGKIESAGRHLLSIINDILDLSKIEADRLELERRDFHLSAVLDHVRSIVADEARAKGLEVEVDGDDVPLWLRGDATRLRQALLNFASNAVKFTERGRVTLRAVRLEPADAGPFLVRFEVEDTGPGIAPEVLPKLFHAFEQGDPSTTREHGGTGLGLVIARRLAELMGGEAGADSTPGVGSRFWFTARLRRGRGVLPAASEAPSAGSAEEQLRAHAAGRHVLLAEDNAINREVALELLHAVGLQATTAENGREALRLAEGGRFDVVLMDVQMPQLDGLAATRRIRALDGWAAVPILAMTANAFEEDRRACLAAGMNDFVPKPVDPAQLYERLWAWLAGSDDRRDEARTEAPPPEPPTPDAATTPAPPTPDAATTPARLQAFEGVPGLDASWLARVARGDARFARHLVNAFADVHAGDPVALRAAVGAADWRDLRRMAHALAGAAGNVGATALRHAAAAAERAAVDAERDPVEGGRRAAAEARALADALERTIATLRATLLRSPASPDQAGGAGPGHAADVQERLLALLRRADVDALDLVASETATLRDALGATVVDELVACLERYDFDGALARLTPGPT